MSDPASLNVGLRLTGLSTREVGILIGALPLLASAHISAAQPAVGGKRFSAEIDGMSVTAAIGQLSALREDMEEVSNGG